MRKEEFRTICLVITITCCIIIFFWHFFAWLNSAVEESNARYRDPREKKLDYEIEVTRLDSGIWEATVKGGEEGEQETYRRRTDGEGWITRDGRFHTEPADLERARERVILWDLELPEGEILEDPTPD